MIKTRSFNATALEKVAVTVFDMPARHSVLVLTRSNIKVKNKYTLMIADGLIERACSIRDRIHRVSAATNDRLAATIATLELEDNDQRTRSAACAPA